MRSRTCGTCSCWADLVMILFLDSQCDFVLEKSSLGGYSHGLSRFCFVSQTARSRTLKSCRCLRWIFICVTVRIRTRESSWCTRTNICVCFSRWVFFLKATWGASSLWPGVRSVLSCGHSILGNPAAISISAVHESGDPVAIFFFCDPLVRWSTCHKYRCDPLSRVIHSRTTPGIMLLWQDGIRRRVFDFRIVRGNE